MTSSDVSQSRWSHLPADIVALISKRLDDAVGNLRLRSVCSNWRSAVPIFKPPLKTLPYVTFVDPNRRGHFSLSSSTIYLLQSAAIEDKSSPWWLLRVERKGDSGKFRPLSPFSRFLTEEHIPKGFPRGLDLLNVRVHEIGKAYSLDMFEQSNETNTNYYAMKSRKVVASSGGWSGGPDEGDSAILSIFGRKLGFIKRSDENWTQIDDPNGSYSYDDILYSKEKQVFYAADMFSRLIKIDRDLKVTEVVPAVSILFGGGIESHLIESNGELFLVNKHTEPELHCADDSDEEAFEIDGHYMKYTNLEFPLHLKVYKLNEKMKDWEYVHSLGDRVFFIGYDCSYDVPAKHFGLEGNCIYFASDEIGEEDESYANIGKICPDAGIFCLKDKSCGSLASFPDRSQIFLNSPAWLKSPETKALKSKGEKHGSKK